jgi:hypothetical protein
MNDLYNVRPEPCPECGSPDADYLPHEPGCPSGHPTRDADDTPTGRAIQAHIDELPAGTAGTLDDWRPGADEWPGRRDADPRDELRPVRRGPEDAELDMVAGPGYILPRAQARDALSYCNSCDQPSAELDPAGYCPACAAEARTFSAPDLPAGATVEPWTDADTDELAEAMSAAAERRRRAWSDLVAMSRARRAVMRDAAGLLWSELATATARFGIVADPAALPIIAVRPARVHHANDADPYAARRAEVIARQRSTGDVWAGIEAARYNGAHRYHGRPGSNDARLYERSDAFEEQTRSDIERQPIYAAGRAALAR